MIINAIFVSLTVGFMGAAHCMGMCGGIVGALSFSTQENTPSQRYILILSYNLGRLLSYTLLGLIAGGLGDWFVFHVQAIIQFPLLRFLATTLIIFLGFYLMGWPQLLAPLEKMGMIIWRYIQPLTKSFIPIRSLHQGLMVGMVWGWLPCGLVYTALTYALAQESAISGGLVMLAFGVGTLPALLIGGLAGQRLKTVLQSRNLRRVSGVLMLLFGLISMWGVLHHHHEHPNAVHNHQHG